MQPHGIWFHSFLHRFLNYGSQAIEDLLTNLLNASHDQGKPTHYLVFYNVWNKKTINLFAS